jgi:hypothetical protein
MAAGDGRGTGGGAADAGCPPTAVSADSTVNTAMTIRKARHLLGRNRIPPHSINSPLAASHSWQAVPALTVKERAPMTVPNEMNFQRIVLIMVAPVFGWRMKGAEQR